MTQTAHSKGFARAALNYLPETTKAFAEFDKEGREDFKLYGDNAKNPYMGEEGDAWSRGYWTAVLNA